MPREVSPLVDEVNDLLTAQENIILKAKSRTDNLAHGFKTPLTALISDIKRLRDKGENEIAADIESTSLIMRRQIERIDESADTCREAYTVDRSFTRSGRNRSDITADT